MCRHWRQHRRLSQLELALAADISQRHISWLENGKSRPSKDMVIRLSEAMDLPLRERNILLNAAGFTDFYDETPLEAPTMAPVLEAFNRMLSHHDPMPAFVVDRFWNVVKKNRAAEAMLNLAGDIKTMMADVGMTGEINLALLTLHPNGLRNYVTNWEQAAPEFVRRLQREYLATGDAEVTATLQRFIELAGDVGKLEPAKPAPVFPLDFQIGDIRLSLFTVLCTLSSPLDITTDELRLEAFYAADEHTEAFFANLIN